jgi:hypothetical protein
MVQGMGIPPSQLHDEDRDRSALARLGPRTAIGIVPFLMLAHGLVLFGSEWVALPGILQSSYFYMTLGVQFALTVLLGVALASGFEREER